MPIRRGSVNFARFRVQGDVPRDSKRWLQGALKKHAFEPIDPKSDEERTAGFVELENNEATDFAAGSIFHGLYALFAWRVDKLRVPGNAVRAELLKWSQAFEAKNERGPGRRERADQKDAIKKALRGKLEPSTKVFEVSLDLAGKELLAWVTSRAVVEEVQAALESTLDVKLVPRVPAAFLDPDVLDAMTPTPQLFTEWSDGSERSENPGRRGTTRTTEAASS